MFLVVRLGVMGLSLGIELPLYTKGIWSKPFKVLFFLGLIVSIFFIVGLTVHFLVLGLENSSDDWLWKLSPFLTMMIPLCTTFSDNLMLGRLSEPKKLEIWGMGVWVPTFWTYRE